ncbi:putative OmpA/MotB domain protein [Candidatus Filomicrobium marinum]|uniref:Putative OmpA/MotB domain protein n=1 Tax=Candidatus Filomicrobium marinum TaxID=1608628 RepID=A0A0D6JHJ1_9HYPH|nr:OmpA family protein [Candidatus Filomicrobium marinum]CFX42527.1 putative OmpA/MotB domain protein [Candidatus Filomicrobium marinum]CPR21065.1 putative OmpA/MotB domain protein [Candidatus Filomicrobium marinum]
MSCNPWRWLWGLLPLAILVWLTVVEERPRIEADLTARTQQALKVAGVDWANLTFSGREGTLAGHTSHDAEPEKAIQIAHSVWGVRTLAADIRRADTINDYFWQAEAADSGIRLAGYVPDETKRNTVIGLVRERFPDRPIDDRMKIGLGGPDPDPWLKTIGFGLDRLGQVKSGNVEVHQLALSVSGEALSHAAYRSAKSALSGDLPPGATLIADKITPPVVSPFKWGMQKTATQIVLNGYVPDQSTREQLFDKAKTTFPKLAIIDRMEVAGGAQEGWYAAAVAVLNSLLSLSEADVQASDGAITLKGRTPDEATAARVVAALQSALPATFKARTDLSYPPPPPPIVSPFTTHIEMRPGFVSLTGYVPSDAARTAVMTQLQKLLPDAKSVDKLALGSGAPEGWQACLFAGLDALAKLGNGTLALSDRSMQLTGRTRDEALAEALPAQVRAAANRACDSKVEIALDVPPEPNLKWRAESTGNGELTLEGEVPDKASETLLVSSAEQLFSGARLINKMTLASGTSEKWQKVSVAALQLLAKLRRGEAILDGQQLTLRGEASDAAVASAVKDQISHTLPKGYVGKPEIIVRSEAMIWADKEAKRKAAEEAARRQAEEAAKQKEEADRVAEEEAQRQAAEAEARKQEEQARLETQRATEEAARRAAEEEAAQKAAEEARRKAEEEADRRREAEAAAAAAAQARAANKPNNDPSPSTEQQKQRKAEASRCEELLQSAAATGSIRFRFASARLESGSTGTLDRLVEIVKGCPDFRIEVIGHTDAIGPSDQNLILSKERAQVVINYLTNAGVDTSRLSATGYGETRPIVPNTSASNRARNRRIEFSVKTD